MISKKTIEEYELVEGKTLTFSYPTPKKIQTHPELWMHSTDEAHILFPYTKDGPAMNGYAFYQNDWNIASCSREGMIANINTREKYTEEQKDKYDHYWIYIGEIK